MKPSLAKFDFDEWAQLYKSDPFAFESRRQAALVLESLKGGPAARETANMLIAQKPSRDRQVRLEGALNQMTRSMTVLSIQLNELARVMHRIQVSDDLPGNAPANTLSPSPSATASPRIAAA